MHIIEHTYECLLADVASHTGLREIRGSYEGLHWCLNEAPKLEKLVLEAIETGRELDLERFPTWIRRLAAGSVEDPVKLRYLRQLLLFCYKADVTPDNDKITAAYQGFLVTNQLVREFGNGMSKSLPRLFDQVRRHCQSVLYRVRFEAIRPQHGPGASTTPKEVWTQWYKTIEACYPYSDYFSLYQNRDHIEEFADRMNDDIQIEAKLIHVPKDTRGPRLICVHPAESIWIQQGLRLELERAISLQRDSFSIWPRGRIRFDDQTVNGRIAKLSSRSRRYATIDMKEASDRISEPLVQALFGRYYKWFGCCRAQKVVIPTLQNRVEDIHSYAPMGNATTFPVQSLVFWAICVASMQSRGFHQPGAVFVFGDDIIVPTECAEFVIDDLESFGLLVNRSKTFWRGAFRESCGVDAFNGKDVTPIRWKTTLDAEQLVGMQSLSDMAMRLRIAGYEQTAATCYAILRGRLKALRGKPLLRSNDLHHGGICEYTMRASAALEDAYWHHQTQQFVSPVWRVETRGPSAPLSGWNHVLESVLSLERTGHSSIPDRTVSRRSRLVRGWIPVKLDRLTEEEARALSASQLFRGSSWSELVTKMKLCP